MAHAHHFILFSVIDMACFSRSQVEREKVALVSSLQESQKQLAQTRGALARLSDDFGATKRVQVAKDGEKGKESGGDGDVDYYELDIHGPEILRCKYEVSVAEAGELREELKLLKAELEEVRQSLHR